MISVSDEIKLRAEIAAKLTLQYETAKVGYHDGNHIIAVKRANRIVDEAIKASLKL